MKHILPATLLLLVAGCAGINGGPNMNVDQLKAISADKNASVICTRIMGPWGTGVVVAVNLDQRVVQDGSVTTDGATCNTTISNTIHDKPVVTAPVAAPKVTQ